MKIFNKLKQYILLRITKIPTFNLLYLLFYSNIKHVSGNLQSVHDLYRKKNGDSELTALDLGCGPNPTNRFNANKSWGLDLYENLENNVIKCKLGFEPIPFESNSIDYVTAYDLLEHIPRFSECNSFNNHTPFIFLINEVHRVLKKNGIFLSSTPIWPYPAAFQDPTHNNIMTAETFRLYFSDSKYKIAEHYGINTDFQIIHSKILNQNLVAVLLKK